MDIAIDPSALMVIIANEPEKHSLVELTRGSRLVAPHSVHWEIGNAFSAMLKRNRVGLFHAQQAIEIYLRIPIRFVDVELSESLEIASALGIYAYDAYLLRCALKYDCPLLSLDRALLDAARRLQVPHIEVMR